MTFTLETHTISVEVNDMQIWTQKISQAIDACEWTGKLLVSQVAQTVEAKEGHANFVTDMDIKVQHLLIEALGEILPEAQIVAEEKQNDRLLKGWTWVIDPIDGTQNFISGLDHSAIAVGLLKDGEAVAGIVHDPFRDETFWAIQGRGAYLVDKRIRVTTKEPGNSVVLVGTSPYRADLTDRSFIVSRRLMDDFADIRRLGSAALDLSYVACGRCAGFFELELQPWDYAAGSVIVREAGGLVESTDGFTTVLFDRPMGILAAAPNALESLRAALKED